MNMFDPKITEGVWVINGYSKSNELFSVGPIAASFNFIKNRPAVSCRIEDAGAICAVPDLLEVYKGLKEALKDYRLFFLKQGKRHGKKLNDLVEKLEERHCEI